MEAFDRFLQGPSVQELAKKPLTAVPDRYIRHDQDPSITDHPTVSFPVIDMQKLLSGEVNSQELQKLHSACKDWGFFQVINHGVSLEVVEKMKVEAESLFKLAPEEKKNLGQRKGGEMEGFGQPYITSEEQKLDWGDMFFFTTMPLHRRKKHIFPHLPQSFREAIEEYCKGVKELAMKILVLMAKALKMEEREMMELFDEEGLQSTKITCYPPCPQPELVAGLSPHSDANGLTVLLQVNEVDGLQVKKDGVWIPIKPLPHAFVINVGDILEMVTNGIYRSIEHRVVVNSSNERLSIGSFHSPRLDADMGPAPSLTTPQRPAIFRRTAVIDYLKGLSPFHLREKYKSTFYI